jgi:FkbM family methyltransferase
MQRKVHPFMPSFPFARVASLRLDLSGHSRTVPWAWTSSPCGGLKDKKWEIRDNPDEAIEVLFSKQYMDWVGNTQDLKPKREGVAIDIGAHLGDTMISMALLADQTLAFDPNPDLFPILDLNAKLNSDLGITAFNLGIGSNDTDATFQYGAMCNGGMAGYGNKTANGQQKRMFHVVRLESFLEKTYGPAFFKRIRYIKTDAEGYDSEILESLIPMLHKMDRKPLIMVEWFKGFQRGPDSETTPGSKRLFEVLAKLSSNYATFCCEDYATFCGKRAVHSGENANWCHDVLLKPYPSEVLGRKRKHNGTRKKKNLMNQRGSPAHFGNNAFP